MYVTVTLRSGAISTTGGTWLCLGTRKERGCRRDCTTPFEWEWRRIYFELDTHSIMYCIEIEGSHDQVELRPDLREYGRGGVAGNCDASIVSTTKETRERD